MVTQQTPRTPRPKHAETKRKRSEWRHKRRHAWPHAFALLCSPLNKAVTKETLLQPPKQTSSKKERKRKKKEASMATPHLVNGYQASTSACATRSGSRCRSTRCCFRFHRRWNERPHLGHGNCGCHCCYCSPYGQSRFSRRWRTKVCLLRKRWPQQKKSCCCWAGRCWSGEGWPVVEGGVG